MTIPEDLSAWTFDTVVEVVEQHDYERGRYEYKIALHDRDAKDYKDTDSDSLRFSTHKPAASMGNTAGGFILFGVRDRAHKVAAPRDRIVGISVKGDLRRERGEKLQGIQRELTGFEAKAIPLPASDGTDGQ